MIPEAFTYERAGTVAEALEHMGRGALPLAGGHSLLPALKLRLSAPEALVDIARIPELSGIRVDGGTLVVGACTRHRVIASSAEVAAHAPVLASAAGEIGDQLVRNRGTIGGSLAQADPHGDLPAVALAVGAEIVVQSPAGTRTVAADNFFVDYFTTALDEGELITEIRIPGGQSQGAYAKFNRRTADWALMAAAVCADQTSAASTAPSGPLPRSVVRLNPPSAARRRALGEASVRPLAWVGDFSCAARKASTSSF